MLYRIIFSSFFIFLFGCNLISNDDSQNIARYDDSLLTNKEFINLMGNYDKNDSVSRANNIINNWAINKILIERAKLNLNDSKLQSIELLVKDYEASLLSEAYLEALINSSINPDIIKGCYCLLMTGGISHDIFRSGVYSIRKDSGPDHSV